MIRPSPVTGSKTGCAPAPRPGSAGCACICDYALQRAQGASDGDLRAILDRYGMVVPSVEFLADWHDTGAQADEHIRLAFAAAHCFGAKVVNVGADAGSSGLQPGQVITPLRRLCDRAEAESPRIAVEFVAWGGQTPTAVAELIDVAGGKAGLLLDNWHLSRRGIRFEDLQALPPEMVLGLQISDAAATASYPLPEDTLHRRFCGAGALDIVGFLTLARRQGWQAPVAVEVIAPEVAAMPVASCAGEAFAGAAALMREVWP